MQVPFTKMHGLGNDFVVLDATRPPLAEMLRNPPVVLLRLLGDRRFGVGCDQVLVIDPSPAAGVDFGYRIFNADGSESGQCGNGVRCVARYVRERGLSGKDVLRVRTATSTMDLYQLGDGRVRVNMGPPRLAAAEIPLALKAGGAAGAEPHYRLRLDDGSELRFAAVNMGNPHAVIEVADLETAAVAATGAALQTHQAFPLRINAGFVQFRDNAHARLRVYERGAGETLACGSGACAAMVAGRLWGKLGPRAVFELRGGALELEWAGVPQGELATGAGAPAEPVWMTGPAKTVFEGVLEWPN
jgi:diaminopimelate epimerase